MVFRHDTHLYCPHGCLAFGVQWWQELLRIPPQIQVCDLLVGGTKRTGVTSWNPLVQPRINDVVWHLEQQFVQWCISRAVSEWNYHVNNCKLQFTHQCIKQLTISNMKWKLSQECHYYKFKLKILLSLFNSKHHHNCVSHDAHLNYRGILQFMSTMNMCVCVGGGGKVLGEFCFPLK